MRKADFPSPDPSPELEEELSNILLTTIHGKDDVDAENGLEGTSPRHGQKAPTIIDAALPANAMSIPPCPSPPATIDLSIQPDEATAPPGVDILDQVVTLSYGVTLYIIGGLTVELPGVACHCFPGPERLAREACAAWFSACSIVARGIKARALWNNLKSRRVQSIGRC